MSDPVTNAEVEDVLSSIRRLVSEDKRPFQSTDHSGKNDRLVLTPALRVADGTDRSGQHDSKVSANPADDYSADPYDFADTESELVQWGDSATAQDDAAAQSDHSDGVVHENQNEPSHHVEARDDATLMENHVAEDQEDHETRDENSMLEDQSGEADLGRDMSQDNQADDVSDETAIAQLETPMTKAAALRAKIAELEAEIGNISSDWNTSEQQDSDAHDAASDAMAWEEASPADAIPTGVHRYEDHAAEDEPEQNILNALDEAREEFEHHSDDAENDGQPDASSDSVADMAAMAADEGDNIHHSEQDHGYGEHEHEHDQGQDAHEAQHDQHEEPIHEEETDHTDDHGHSDEEPVAEWEDHVEATHDASELDHGGEATDAASDDQDDEESHEWQGTNDETSPAEERGDALQGGGLELAEDGAVLDEEALRDLVSEIVRSELQGDLGERITRNVRKLVRREIHRALTAQELE